MTATTPSGAPARWVRDRVLPAVYGAAGAVGSGACALLLVREVALGDRAPEHLVAALGFASLCVGSLAYAAYGFSRATRFADGIVERRSIFGRAAIPFEEVESLAVDNELTQVRGVLVPFMRVRIAAKSGRRVRVSLREGGDDAGVTALVTHLASRLAREVEQHGEARWTSRALLTPTSIVVLDEGARGAELTFASIGRMLRVPNGLLVFAADNDERAALHLDGHAAGFLPGLCVLAKLSGRDLK